MLAETKRANDHAAEANKHAREANELTRIAVQDQLDERIRRQASLVSAWISRRVASTVATTYVVAYRNASHQPVTQCHFMITHAIRGDLHDKTLELVPPDTTSGELALDMGAPPSLEDRPLLTLEFTDAGGRRWRREPVGDLRLVGAPAVRREGDTTD